MQRVVKFFLNIFTSKSIDMTRQIFAAEINFEDTPLHVREKFNETEANIKQLLVGFKAKVEEVFIIATRYRFTVYVVHENLKPLTDYFHIENPLKGYVQFYYNSGESVTHLMATASGLLSPVKGEGRILAEMMKGYQWAIACATIGITLDSALTRAIETARTVRTETGIDKFCASVVETGIELLYNRIEDLHAKKFLIVGTGKMARLALEYLTREGIRNIAITGHDQRRAQHLAKKFGLRVFHLDVITDYFYWATVVIGVSHEDLKIDLITHSGEEPEPEHPGKTRFILDLGIPPNFDARTVDDYAAEFYNLDDLRRLQASPLEAFGGLEAAWRMVMKASNDFTHLLELLNQSPVLSAYLTRQFILKKPDLVVKPRRSLRHLFLFRKAKSATDAAPAEAYINARAHTNNYAAENAVEIVRNVGSFEKFKIHLTEN